ncbi:C10 family peptidase [Prevotella sp. E15-22]|uniref:C10 family peptidase n=1 Tax=Prevotella sp. E15-22 TaxID=2937774 RepID=UPI0020552FAB|nr:C10 family peptidase [Prevotella sp. E15-22]UPS44968.1 C10 family peptidase [Prevotella sp. E15-22]
MIKKITFAILVFGLTATQAIAAPRTAAQMKQAALKAINQHRSNRRMAPRADAPEVLKSTSTYEIIGYKQGGFAVVSADDLVPEVLGVSTSDYSEGRNANFQWWLNAASEAVNYAVQNNIQLTTTKPDPSLYPTEVGPLLTTRWDQETPYNNMCPTYSGSTKCLTGCVATAMAQVLNYHKMPEHGEGQRTIYYPHGNHSGQAVSANFSEDYYDWNNMLDDYSTTSYTKEQADAVALLMRDCGVAADMEYGGPSDGSGAYSQDAAAGLRKYFGFAEAQCVERDYYKETTWMNMVYRELSENGPMYYGGADAYGKGGHAFVLHGYRADGKVLVNWGWSGSDDGYYDIAILDPSYYRFSQGQDMIIGVKSNTHSLYRSEIVTTTAEGMLKQAVEALEGEGQIGSLTVNGPLGFEDLKYLRHLAGRDSLDGESGESVRLLNLTNTQLHDNVLPDSIFKNCVSLQRIYLPATVEHIGREAFSGCSHLYELRVPTKVVPVLDGPRVFQDVPMGSCMLYVRSGMKTKYLKKAQWKSFGEKNIGEEGTSIQARNTIRKYGEENPEFYYTISGDDLHGQPELVCEATPSSPAGRYPIYVKRGTIDRENVDFIDGYLVVQKLDATATVGNYTREEGQPNPEFGFSAYDGLISLDSIPVWLETPVFVTTADETSPAGDYPIMVESATAESYNMTFVTGVLTVTVSTAINGIDAAQRQQSVYYTLGGSRVEGATRAGIYLMRQSNGKVKKVRVARK